LSPRSQKSFYEPLASSEIASKVEVAKDLVMMTNQPSGAIMPPSLSMKSDSEVVNSELNNDDDNVGVELPLSAPPHPPIAPPSLSAVTGLPSSELMKFSAESEAFLREILYTDLSKEQVMMMMIFDFLAF
jgi:hypothetical protein